MRKEEECRFLGLGACRIHSALHLSRLGFSLALLALSRLIHIRVGSVGIGDALLLARDSSWSSGSAAGSSLSPK